MTIEEIQAIQPDALGTIYIEVNGTIKRYIKAILIDCLIRNPNALISGKPKRKREPPKIKVKKEKLHKGPDLRGIKNRVPVTATMPDGREINFESSRAAIRALKVGKSSISKVLKGHQAHVQNIKFKFQKIA